MPDSPVLRPVRTCDAAPPPADPLLDRLVASVNALEDRVGKRRPKLTVVKGGRDVA